MEQETSWMRRMIGAEAHHHLAIALAVGVCVFAAVFRVTDCRIAVILFWNAFSLTSSLLAWGGMLACGAKTRVEAAQMEDSNRAIIASCLIVAALVSLGGAAYLLHTAKDLTGKDLAGHISLAAMTIVFSWSLVHTLLAVRYTHLFYAKPEDMPEAGPEGGLDFPNEKEPDFFDFAYFSFVIGMTFQVSDVQVTSGSLRRLVLVHSLLSFAFNTVIVAFSINLATTLL